MEKQKEWLEKIWEENCQYLQGLCEYKLSGINKVDECMSDIYISLVQAMETGIEILYPRAWLTTVAVNKINDCYRSVERARANVISMTALGDTLCIHDHYYFDEISDDEINNVKERVLDYLDMREKEVITDYYQNGIKIKKIAQNKGLSESNVKQILFRARGKIRYYAKKELNEHIKQNEG